MNNKISYDKVNKEKLKEYARNLYYSNNGQVNKKHIKLTKT